jgi:hypothetical protein
MIGEFYRFVKTPEPGNKVKVYHGGDAVSYGIVKYVIESKSREREIVVLKEVEEQFDLMECDFCLPVSSIMFNKVDKDEFN